MLRSLVKTVVFAGFANDLDLNLKLVLNLLCGAVLINSLTSFLTSTLALVFALAVAHVESRSLTTK
jgi:hypothetical protein